MIMRRTLIALAGAAGLASLSVATLTAQPQLPGAVDPARVEAGTYAADAGHSLVVWRVNHFGFNDYVGIFGNVSGTLQIDPANLAAAKVDVTIPIASVTTASAGLTEHLMRAAAQGAAAPDFFGPNPAPARFVSKTVHTLGENRAHIIGDLTLNGITREVTVQARFVGAGNNPFSRALTVGFEGETTITRSQWGLGGFIPLVGDEVKLDITVAFEKR